MAYTTTVALIGAETEYGILVQSDDGRAYGGDGTGVVSGAVSQMMKEALDITGGVCLDEGKIESEEEHDDVEQLMRDLRWEEMDDPRIYRQLQRLQIPMRQRRGYTGSMLYNGARFYMDMGHPEYSIPECADPFSALCAARAGDEIVQEAARRSEKHISKLLGSKATIRIIKNNSDGDGHSYAGHENYLLLRPAFNRMCEVSPESDLAMLFFVARQILTGAGKLGSENTRTKVPLQISQRADFFVQNFSDNTTSRRGIINLRDVPYADHQKYGRFHVIVGDTNRSDLSCFLKFGISSIFFTMLNMGALENFKWFGSQLVKPARALRLVSRDLTLSRKLQFVDGRQATALEIMHDLCHAATMFVLTNNKLAFNPHWKDVCDKWFATLEGLQGDRHKHPLARSLDWVALERLVMDRVRKTGESPDSLKCQARDLSYRTLKEDSVFTQLEKKGEIVRLADDASVSHLFQNAPRGTRAGIRSQITKRYGKEIRQMRWDEVDFLNGDRLLLLEPGWGDQIQIEPLFPHSNVPLERFLKDIREMYPNHARVTSSLERREDDQ